MWLLIYSLTFLICCIQFSGCLSWLELGSTCSSSCCSLFSQLTIVPLQVLKSLLLSLSLLDRARYKVSTVSPVGRLGGQRVGLLTCYWEMHCFFLSNVPVSHIIEVEPAHVVALDSADLLTCLVHLAIDIVLLPEHVRSEFIISG